MLFHDFLKKTLFNFLSLEFLDKNLKDSLDESSFNIEIPNKKFGDVSTNIAMIFCKKLGTSPKDLANRISIYLKKNLFIKDIDIVGPGFINIHFKSSYWQDQLKQVFKNLEIYKYKIKKKNICLEFVSANPTGLMHIGHARGAVLGDTLSSILEEVGHNVTKEYYINDAGEQIKKLINTVIYHSEPKKKKEAHIDDKLYPGEYLEKLSKTIFKDIKNKNISNDLIEEKIINFIMSDIKKDLKMIRVVHDSFVSEKKNSSKQTINNFIKILNEKELIYEGFQGKPKSLNNEEWKKEKLLLFKSQQLGDDNDRALMKPNGEPTYFMTDIIYHQKKIDKNYDILLNIWGVDHSGYVKRLENALKQLNLKKKYSFEIKLTSLVNLMNGNKVLKMSKRDGNYVTLREVVEEVGCDALRFMMVSRNADKKIDFDFETVKLKSKDNPVFYVQYAYARCKSLIEIFKRTFDYSFDNFNLEELDLSYLNADEDKNLIIKLSNFFNIIISSANFYEPHRITSYLYELAKDFHAYWGLGKTNTSKKIILDDNFKVSLSRISLVIVISLIIKKSMDLLKIECPENM